MGVRPHTPASQYYGLEVGPPLLSVYPSLVLRNWSNAM